MHKGFSRFWQCLLLLCCLQAGQALAQSAVFPVEVSVDVTGAEQADARAKAMKQAETEGLKLLLAKLAPEKAETFLPTVDEAAMATLLKGIEVIDEKPLANRYRAQLRVNYDTLALSKLLEKHVALDDAETSKSTAVLILPVYEENDELQLWERDNPWRDVWAQVALEKSGGNLIVPYADSVDMRLYDKAEAANATFAGLSQLIARYGVSEVVLVKASLHSTPSLSLDVNKRQINRERNEAFALEFQADLQENKQALLTRAAREIAEQVERMREESISRRALGADAAEGAVLLLSPLSTMDSWVATRKALQDVPGVERLETVAITPQQVDVMAYFRGPRESLARALKGKGFLVKEENNYWIISRE